MEARLETKIRIQSLAIQCIMQDNSFINNKKNIVDDQVASIQMTLGSDRRSLISYW